jgi:hypothetical protein
MFCLMETLIGTSTVLKWTKPQEGEKNDRESQKVIARANESPWDGAEIQGKRIHAVGLRRTARKDWCCSKYILRGPSHMPRTIRPQPPWRFKKLAPVI